MSEAQAKEFRILAVGYAVMRELAEETGPVATRALTASFGAETMARSLGRAAIAAVDATAEDQAE